MAKKVIYLIAHVNKEGTGVGQRQIPASTEKEAIDEFKRQCPKRDILTTGIKGVEG